LVFNVEIEGKSGGRKKERMKNIMNKVPCGMGEERNYGPGRGKGEKKPLVQLAKGGNHVVKGKVENLISLSSSIHS